MICPVGLYQELTTIQENGYFILCDAGGGTVDVVSYKARQLQPTLQLQQITVPTGRKCGSVFINIEFQRWLRQLLGDRYYSQIDPGMGRTTIASHSIEGRAMRELMRDFDILKREFTGDTGQILQIDLPSPLDDLNIPGVVDFGQITLKESVMERFFDVCVGQIVTLIRDQADQIERKGGRPKNVIMVGGFAESVYLQRQIETTLSMYRLNLRRPETSWTAVVQGAALCGIEKSTMRNLRPATSCRHHYGINVNPLFSDVHYERRDKVEVHGVALARGQMTWLWTKGDLVLVNEEQSREQIVLLSFTKTETRVKKLSIYRYSDNDRPDRYQSAREELFECCSLTIDLAGSSLEEFQKEKGFRKNPDTYNAEVTVALTIKNDRMRASVTWKGKELAFQDSIPY